MDILGCLSEKICIFPDFLETLFSASHIYMNTKKSCENSIYIYICNLNILNSLHIFANVHLTARKRSLGQGNIFRSMCPSFCPEGVGGMCSRGVCVAGGVFMQERQPLKRAVRILLECILVSHCV